LRVETVIACHILASGDASCISSIVNFQDIANGSQKLTAPTHSQT
jgi:hypothetical protein